MIGTKLGSWILDRELGRGGMGRVYLAHDGTDGRFAAIKVLAGDLVQEPGFLQRFQREIDVLDKLDHPNIVRFYESGCQDGIYYFAMEYLDGENFEQLLHHKNRLPWKDVLDAALQVCPALKHAHDRGIVHRDIKPPNLQRNSAGQVKLTDFGIAKVFAARHLTNTGGVVGTAEYLSPEQAAGKQATKRSDLYSLGVVLYTLLTGRTPFEGNSTAEIMHKHLYGQFDPPKKLVPEMPYEFDEIICQLLEKDPSRRPADGMVLHRELDKLRRRLERKAQLTVLRGPEERTLVDNKGEDPAASNPGQATLMSRLMRNELEQQKQGSSLTQWLNKPWILLPLFVVCVVLIAYRFWPNPGPDPEILFQNAASLMQSEDPDDWDAARDKFLEPLRQAHPDYRREDVDRFRQRIEDHSALSRALKGIKAASAIGEAQRFYMRGLRLCQEGDPAAARQVWQQLVRAFGKIESAQRWVQLAEEGLAVLDQKAPMAEGRQAVIKEALTAARRLRDENKREEAEGIWKGLEALYREDALADVVLKQIQHDRGR